MNLLGSIFNLNSIEAIAREAGGAVMKIHENFIDITYKDNSSPLTNADLASNLIITKALKEEFPEIPILSEEATSDFKSKNLKDYYWLVDPLDGTKEFIDGNEDFTINIALISHGKPVMGVVFVPAKNFMYRASEGQGAFKRLGNGKLKRIYVSPHKDHLPWKVLISRSHKNSATDEYLSQLGNYELIVMGSSLKICLIAEGAAHLYPRFGLTHSWDTGAAHAILREAGGEIKTLSGNILNYLNTTDTLNPFFIASYQK